MALVDTEAARLAEAYAEFVVGKPIAEIAREWNAAGVRSSTGAEWSQPSVHQLLRNPRNAALRAYRGEIVGPAAWPPVVDEATYRAALARLTSPERRTGGGGQARYLLTGLALCGLCGATVRKGQRPRDGVAFYRCGKAQHLSRTLEHVDRFVVDVILGRLARPDAADLLIDHQAPDTVGLTREAEEVRKRLDTLAVEFADGALTGSQLRAATERLRARLTELEQQMAHGSRAPVLRALVAAPDIRAEWERTPVHRQRAVIDALAVVTLLRAARGPRFDPSSVDIVWRDQT
ncbi:MAG: recombinase family protein [Pseudonocardia sp.]|nr:recombinase family protein [Pseudonocardia sp.]